jgi:esterase/lipase superfamily enzyme
MMRIATVSVGVMLLSGCSLAVDYGMVPHGRYVADPRCQSTGSVSQTAPNLPYFFVTSRLPDCRTAVLTLTNQRAGQLRYGRFADAQADKPAKRDRAIPAQLAFEGEASWWAALRAAAGRSQGRVLLFVHGYHESFKTSSELTSQIARLTNFEGAVIHYSWPSQAKIISYTVDETNAAWDNNNFFELLKKLSSDSAIKQVIVVSHSLGTRLVLPAIAKLDGFDAESNRNSVNQIILASADIDREDFESNFADRLLAQKQVQNGRLVTLYVSGRDTALSLSRRLHGYPRLGSTSCFNPFEATVPKKGKLSARCYPLTAKTFEKNATQGLVIVDTTDVSKSRAGHWDFLQSAPACLDFAATVAGSPGEGRLATGIPFVFGLPAPDKKSKINHRAICKRP